MKSYIKLLSAALLIAGATTVNGADVMISDAVGAQKKNLGHAAFRATALQLGAKGDQLSAAWSKYQARHVAKAAVVPTQVVDPVAQTKDALDAQIVGINASARDFLATTFTIPTRDDFAPATNTVLKNDGMATAGEFGTVATDLSVILPGLTPAPGTKFINQGLVGLAIQDVMSTSDLLACVLSKANAGIFTHATFGAHLANADDVASQLAAAVVVQYNAHRLAINGIHAAGAFPSPADDWSAGFDAGGNIDGPTLIALQSAATWTALKATIG